MRQRLILRAFSADAHDGRGGSDHVPRADDYDNDDYDNDDTPSRYVPWRSDHSSDDHRDTDNHRLPRSRSVASETIKLGRYVGCASYLAD